MGFWFAILHTKFNYVDRPKIRKTIPIKLSRVMNHDGPQNGDISWNPVEFSAGLLASQKFVRDHSRDNVLDWYYSLS